MLRMLKYSKRYCEEYECITYSLHIRVQCSGLCQDAYFNNTGAFHLSVKSLPVRLNFCNVGYQEKVLQVHSSDNLAIQLKKKVIVRGDNEKIYAIGSPKSPRRIVFYPSQSPYQQLASELVQKRIFSLSTRHSLFQKRIFQPS